MFSKKEFATNTAREVLSVLKGRYEYSADGENIDVVNDTLEKVLFNLNIYGNAPKPVLTRSLYEDENGNLMYAKFTVKPSSKNALSVDACKHEFKLIAGVNFYDSFIEEMIKWFSNYDYLTVVEANLDELNGKIAEIIEANEIDKVVEFTLGSGIVDATDTYVKVGLELSVIQNLSTLPLFDENTVERAEAYTESIVDLLTELNRPCDIVKTKGLLTRDLGIYSRRGVHKMLRDFTNRKVEFVRTGVGYVDTEEVFAVVSRVAVKEDALEELPEGAVVTEIVEPTSKERKAGLTHIVSTYKVSPFNKADGTPAELDLAGIVK